MRLLLDTHIFIRTLDDDPKLSDAAWSTIDAAEAVYISSASIWEATMQCVNVPANPNRRRKSRCVVESK